MAFRASFHLDSSSEPADVFFTALSNNDTTWIEGADLHFLTVVEVAKIPIRIVSGPHLTVQTDSADLESWFSHVLVGPHHLLDQNEWSPWWRMARTDSQLGVLAAVRIPCAALSKTCGSSVTELLLYATRPETVGLVADDDNTGKIRDDQAHLEVHALPLCSGLLDQAAGGELRPPTSPITSLKNENGFLLSTHSSLPHEPINEVQVRKRKSASDFFDEAAERRHKARRRGVQGVSATTAPSSESQTPPLNHRRSISNGQYISLQTKPISRSPSVTSSRPGTAVTASINRSSLSRVQSAAGTSILPDMGAKNKDSISRIVMAGMRLYGLSQKRNRKSQATSSPAPDPEFEDLESDRKRDDEYKNIYHQTLKGTCFAFRAIIDNQDMQPLSEAIRDVVDRLLAIFCINPLGDGLSTTADKLTPGGRKAFGAK